MKAYAHAAGQFLAAHPDFVDAPLIRHQYAMCLGFTGRQSEALEQVKILARGEGKEAEEARAYLAEKESKAKGASCGGGQSMKR